MLIMICGLPRAGKTTYASTFSDEYKIIHLDNYGLSDTGYARCLRKIPQDTVDENIVVEGVFPIADWRKALAATYQGKKKCIWMDTPIEIRKTRNGYCKYCEYPFEPPTYDEGWDEIVVMKEVPYIGGGTSNDENNTQETSTERSLYSTERKDEGVQTQDI